MLGLGACCSGPEEEKTTRCAPIFVRLFGDSGVTTRGGRVSRSTQSGNMVQYYRNQSMAGVGKDLGLGGITWSLEGTSVGDRDFT